MHARTFRIFLCSLGVLHACLGIYQKYPSIDTLYIAIQDVQYPSPTQTRRGKSRLL
jgi:hypothetical protein